MRYFRLNVSTETWVTVYTDDAGNTSCPQPGQQIKAEDIIVIGQLVLAEYFDHRHTIKKRIRT